MSRKSCLLTTVLLFLTLDQTAIGGVVADALKKLIRDDTLLFFQAIVNDKHALMLFLSRTKVFEPVPTMAASALRLSFHDCVGMLTE
jgi:hypothetical protein